MATVKNVVFEAVRRLACDDARREADILLGHALGKSRAWLVAHAEDEVEDSARKVFDALIARRATGEPVAYLTGVRGFHALALGVTPDVLIPRPETELLVESALRHIPADADCAVADLGTGSGAVALAIAKMRPRARILATDASIPALDVARANAERLMLHNVAFAPGDWCVALGDARFDVIASNPPYIAAADPHLNEGDLRYEPRAALASGTDGLDAIRVIVATAPAHLKAGGRLLLEHGFGQGETVRSLLEGAGCGEVFTARDLEGRERVSGGRIG